MGGFEGMNRVTVMAGAAEPFGRAVLACLLDAGDLVAVVGADGLADDLEAETDGRAAAFSADLTDPDAVTEALDAVVDGFGVPGALVVLVDDPAEAWLVDGGAEGVNAAVQRRVVAPLSLVALAAERMEAGGSIAVVLAAAGAHPVAKALVGACRAALVGFVRGASAELAVADLRINAVLAGPAEAEEGAARPVRRPSLGRRAEPEDVAAAVAFLLSEEAGAISGEVLSVDGGIGAGRRLP